MSLNAYDEDVLAGMVDWARAGQQVVDREGSRWTVQRVYRQQITLARYCALRCVLPGPGLLGLAVGDETEMPERYLEPVREP